MREALQRLVQEVFLNVIPRLGYAVSPITFGDVRQLYELRYILESATVRLAAQRGTEEQLQRTLESSDFTCVYRDRESYSDFLARNGQFRLSIADMVGNQRLIETLSKVLDELKRVFHIGLDLRDSTQEMRDDHVNLARALVSRDAAKAERLVRNEILRSQQRVIDALTGARPLGSGPGLGDSVQIDFS